MMDPDSLFTSTPGEGEYTIARLDYAVVEAIRRGRRLGLQDEDAAYALTCLLVDDLPCNPMHDGKLTNADTVAVIRCLSAVLTRLGIELNVPFRDKNGYTEGPKDSAGRRGYYDSSAVFRPVFEALERYERVASTGGLRGPRGDLRNLISAARRKPEIVWRDVAAGVIEITKNKEHCLLYDRTVGPAGLTWRELGVWWRGQDGNYALGPNQLETGLVERLRDSLDSEPEEILLDAYVAFSKAHGWKNAPVLLPQVYLHYDPQTQRQRGAGGQGRPLARQRMDFLLLASGGRRFVLEVDGRQHYSHDDGTAAPEKYAQMMAEDRRIRLQGYEVHRFGGAEFTDRRMADAMLGDFFRNLLSGQ